MSAIILICMGIVLGAMADVFTKIPNSESVEGEIVSKELSRRIKNHDQRRTYYAYVEYYVNDRPYAIKTKYAASNFYVGDKMKVIYNAQEPTQAIVRPKITTYIVMIGLIIGGILVGFFLYL